MLLFVLAGQSTDFLSGCVVISVELILGRQRHEMRVGTFNLGRAQEILLLFLSGQHYRKWTSTASCRE